MGIEKTPSRCSSRVIQGEEALDHNGPGVLEGADPATLRLRPPCDVCAQDEHRCYRFNEVVACGQR